MGDLNEFHVCGALFAIWAVVVAGLGITREDFPRKAASERVVAAISVLLFVLAVASGIYSSLNEEEEHGEEAEEAALVVLR